MNKEISDKIDEIEKSCYMKSTSNLVKELKQLLQAEELEEKIEFIKGMVVLVNGKLQFNYDYIKKHLNIIEPLDWKTLARTISYAYIQYYYEQYNTSIVIKRVILYENGHVKYFGYKNNEKLDAVFDSYHLNPSGKRQEIDIERG